LYSQERKTVRGSDSLSYATTTFDHDATTARQICTVPSERCAHAAWNPQPKGEQRSRIAPVIKVGQPWERRLTVPRREVPRAFIEYRGQDSSSQSLKVSREEQTDKLSAKSGSVSWRSHLIQYMYVKTTSCTFQLRCSHPLLVHRALIAFNASE
jgi:hypothetical protein